MLKKIFLFFFILFFPVLVMAKSKIVDVDFVGLQNIEEAQAKRYILSLEGTNYSKKTIRKDIKKLYKSGLFGDVSVSKRNVSGGVKIIFKVTESQTVGKVTVIGNKKLKDDDLTEALLVRQYEQVSKGKIAETKNKILKKYEEKGYYLADVETQVEPFDEAKNQVEVVFKIRENKSVKIRRIKFLGNKKFSDKKLRKKIKTKEKGLFSFMSNSGKLEEEKFEQDVQLLRFFYLDNGFLKVKVGIPSVTLTRNKKAIYISIPLEEGDQFKVGRVDIQGDIITTKQELLSLLKQQEGEVYKKSLEIQDLQALQRAYGDQSYAFVNIIPQVELDEATRKANVTYFVQKGHKVKIDKIIIKGNSVTRDKVIRREMRIYENSYFSQSDLELSKMRLYQLGFFEEVNISTPQGNGENTINVVVEVKEKNTGTFSIGAGFSTLESFIFTATVQKENFFGRGWSGGVSANLSKLRQDFMINMSDRYFLDTRWYFGFSLQKFNSQLNSNFDQNRFGGTVTFGRELFDFFHVRFGYELEDVKVLNFSSQVPQFFQDNANGLTSAVNFGVTYDKRDNRITTTKGVYLSAKAEYSDSVLGATNNYYRITSDNRIYFRLPKKIVLKGRSYFGYINSLNDKPIGLFERFFLGGVNTLRGFNLNSIGPSINVPSTTTGGDSTFVYGGNKSVMFNAELEIPIYAPIGFQMVAFVDAGNSFAENENVDFATLRANYGVGLRWQSPFGPLRFEWGFPINKRADESSVVFNFTIGQSF